VTVLNAENKKLKKNLRSLAGYLDYSDLSGSHENTITPALQYWVGVKKTGEKSVELVLLELFGGLQVVRYILLDIKREKYKVKDECDG